MSVRAMLTRVRRLEAERAPVVSPIVRGYGSFEAFAAECEAGLAEGKLDQRDVPVVMHCVARWENDGTWEAWRRTGPMWQLGVR